MPRIRVAMVTLLIVGFLLFLAGLLAEPTGAVESEAPALQPSPRPTTSLPTLRPTSVLPTVGPTTEPPTAEPPSSGPEGPTPRPASPTSTPNPALLPGAGGAPGGAWLLGLGGGFVLVGVLVAVLWRGRV
jgi:hypothetical protein